MYFLFSIIPKILIIPVGVYFYFYFRRLFHFFKLNTSSLMMQMALVILSVAFVWPATYIWGIWAVVVFHVFAFAIVVDIFYWLFKSMIQKHKFLNTLYRVGIIPLICMLCVLGYGYWNMHNVSMTHYTISTQKNIQQNYRIAFLSDLHFAQTMDKQQLDEYCADISSQNPDIVLLGGDIVDEKTSKKDMQDAFSSLSQIENQYGIYYVYGNHDQSSYSREVPLTTEELRQIILDNHITILSDTSYRIQNDLTLVGRLDRSRRKNSSRQDSLQLLKNVDQNDFMIMLDHQPVDLVVNDDFQYDLQLSGHTHGGQIFPVGLISDYLGFGEMNYGYQKMKHMQVIVSSGMAGWGYPIRTGSKSEYVIVDIIKE